MHLKFAEAWRESCLQIQGMGVPPKVLKDSEEK